jgi:hypothetical protein
MPTPAQTFVANLKQTALKRTHIDWLLFLAVSALMLFSVAFVYSASAYFAGSWRMASSDSSRSIRSSNDRIKPLHMRNLKAIKIR